MIKNFYFFLKLIFYTSNFILIILYTFPGSILGWFIYNDTSIQPQITSNFIISSNHVYAFIVLSLLGCFSYEKERIKNLFIYLFSLSIILEFLHIIVPNRGFEWADLFGNIFGVLLIYFFQKIYRRWLNLR
jgi:hypothetical protein